MTNTHHAMPEHRPPRKRRRLVVSCTECHRRKQKCDRDLPCANCRSRNKESGCMYETTAKGPVEEPFEEKREPYKPVGAAAGRGPGLGKANSDSAGDGDSNSNGESLSSVAVALGYSQAGASTMGFLQHIQTEDGSGGDTSSSAPHASLSSAGRDPQTVRERFKGLIRQLPARAYLDRLITIFMTTFNYQYYVIDPDVFREQLERWHALPFRLLTTTGPQGLTPDMRVFPAVLFQVAATALLVVTEEQGGGSKAAEFEALKYAAGMTFEDLAMDYSESGMAIVGLFDKRSLAVTTVQARFLRASFLKFTAQVTESWHMISMAIKDAQELGMHRDSLDPKPVDPSAEAALENEWLIQRRRKMYMILCIWDISMATFLGRPGTINRSHGLPSLPVDTAMPEDRSRTPVVPRDPWKDRPTALAGALWLRELTDIMFDIQDLDQEGPYPRNLTKVDQVHQRIREMDHRAPAMFRIDNPDTRWDGHQDTFWVPLVRYYFASIHAFNRMVLHRPYIFHSEKSRDEALRASLDILEMAGRMFNGLSPNHWRNYNLFYGSFDALVVISTIYIVFPRQHDELKRSALLQFHWAIERFSAMQERNPQAKAAQGILRAILGKFTRAINSTAEGPTPTAVAAPGSGTPASTRGTTDSTGKTLSSFGDQQHAHTLPTSDAGADVSTAFTAAAEPMMHMGRAEWPMPSMDALASLAPMYPTHDLLFKDINVVDGDGTGIPPVSDNLAAAAMADGGQAMMAWHFGGEFSDGTVWHLFNQYEPGALG